MLASCLQLVFRGHSSSSSAILQALFFIGGFVSRSKKAPRSFSAVDSNGRTFADALISDRSAIRQSSHFIPSGRTKRPNKAPEPTTLLVTIRAAARLAPSRVVAHL